VERPSGSIIECKGTASISAGPSQRYGAAPPNKGMQLTIKSVTPFAYAKGVTLLLAADPRRYAPQEIKH